MTIEQYKNLFANIAIKVVSHVKGQKKSQFLMVDGKNAINDIGTHLNTRNWCMEVDYPISLIRYEGTEHIDNENINVMIYRFVQKDDTNGQIVTIQSAKDKLLEVASWLFASQDHNDGFGIIPGSTTKFEDKNFKMQPFIDEKDGLCGHQVNFTFKTIIKLYDEQKINQITDLYD